MHVLLFLSCRHAEPLLYDLFTLLADHFKP
jgi:hypothetical protein